MDTETVILPGFLTDNNGVQQQIGLRCPIWPKLERSFFVSFDAPTLVVSTTIEEDNHDLHCEMGVICFTAPLQQLLADLGLCSFDVALATEEGVRKSLGEPEEKLNGVIMKATVGADKWYRPLGHMNFQSIEKLRKIYNSGVDYTDTFGCNICAVTKSRQQTHPKTTNMSEVAALIMLVYTDLIGLISPNAIDKFHFVSKFTNHYSKGYEIQLMEDKTQIASMLVQYSKAVAVSSG